MNKNFTNLVFEGGGIKGFAYCGVIKELERRDMIKNFNKFSGSSVGAIFAVLLSIGFSADEILEIQNFELNIFNTYSYLFSFYNLWFYYGLFDTELLELQFRKFLQRKINPDITLKELFKKTKNELVIVSCCLNRKLAVYFHHSTFPSAKLIDVVMASISIPIFFKPKKYGYFGTSDYYFDGGVVDNYPLWIFNDLNKLYSNDLSNIDKKEINELTLGVKLLNKNESNNFLVNNTRQNIKNIFNIFSCIIETLIMQIERSGISSSYIKQTIAIKEDTISTIDFSINKETIRFLIDTGIKNTNDYFNNFVV